MPALYFAAGFILGGVLVYLITRLHRREAERTFAALSLDALRKNSADFLKLAGETLSHQTQAGVGELDGKKRLIDQALESIGGELQRVKQCVADLDNKSGQKFSEVTAHLQNAATQTKELHETTFKLQSALGSERVRGQWGERMAEDVLRRAGFAEGLNYYKQKTMEGDSSRPDYTFLLPQGLKLNMDVKFPWDNYRLYLAEETETAREVYKQQFLRDVRGRIKEVTTREYINPAEKTLDYVLIFIPNEQVYSFINEHDHDVIDVAMKSRVVLCSPLTLYATLAIIRQAVDSFNLSRTATSIRDYLAEFEKQWVEFKKEMEATGRHITAAQSEFQRLTTTRTTKLEGVLNRVAELRLPQEKTDNPESDEPPQ
jgi:DNA recombination protein RmuC